METCTYGLGEGKRKSAAAMPKGADYLFHLEVPYHNALYLCLRKKGFNVKYQFPLPVYFQGDQVGEYFADLLLENKVIIEVKAVETLGNVHIGQVINYLHISKFRLGFLVNFQPSYFRYKRLVL